MIRGVTPSGFAFEVDENIADNMELVDALAAMESDEDFLAISRVLKLLLDEKQRRALYDHLRTPDGRVPVKAVSEAILAVFAACGAQGKN